MGSRIATVLLDLTDGRSIHVPIGVVSPVASEEVIRKRWGGWVNDDSMCLEYMDSDPEKNTVYDCLSTVTHETTFCAHVNTLNFDEASALSHLWPEGFIPHAVQMRERALRYATRPDPVLPPEQQPAAVLPPEQQPATVSLDPGTSSSDPIMLDDDARPPTPEMQGDYVRPPIPEMHGRLVDDEMDMGIEPRDLDFNTANRVAAPETSETSEERDVDALQILLRRQRFMRFLCQTPLPKLAVL